MSERRPDRLLGLAVDAWLADAPALAAGKGDAGFPPLPSARPAPMRMDGPLGRLAGWGPMRWGKPMRDEVVMRASRKLLGLREDFFRPTLAQD